MLKLELIQLFPPTLNNLQADLILLLLSKKEKRDDYKRNGKLNLMFTMKNRFEAGKKIFCPFFYKTKEKKTPTNILNS